MGLWSSLANAWAIQDCPTMDNPPDVIAAISYSMTGRGLTTASAAIMKSVIGLAKRFPNAIIAFSTFDDPLEGSAAEEEVLRLKMVMDAGVCNRIVRAGPTLNSVGEAKAFRTALGNQGVHPHNIFIVTGPCSSRSLCYVWRKVFGGAQIMMGSIDCAQEVQSDHPMKLCRSLPVWLAANVARHLALRMFGMEAVSRVRQPTKGFISTFKTKV